MTTELTPEQAEALRLQLAAHDAAQAEAGKAANRVLLAPLVAMGLGGTEPLACSLEGLAAVLREHASAVGGVEASFPSYAYQVATVLDGLDRKLRTMVAANAAAPAEPEPEPEA